ncbi:MAG TPA: sulfite exporter TauE/SafE family protein, partial [Treponemataceae bacterium]|nr:sulfite exporter TauE/SafE family protein [Treponemataceae bacterium]
LLLGISTGTWCVMYCAPLTLPFLFGRENPTYRKNAGLVSLFLGGRLASYAIVGIALGALGVLATTAFDPILARKLSYGAFIITGAVLLLESVVPGMGHKCAALHDGTANGDSTTPAVAPRVGMIGRFIASDASVAALAGLGAGLHICPPFWAAAARAVSSANVASGAAYFLLFYAGTLPFFLPLLGIPFFSAKAPFVRRIARLAQLMLGIYFVVFAGLFPVVFGGQ